MHLWVIVIIFADEKAFISQVVAEIGSQKDQSLALEFIGMTQKIGWQC